MHKSVFDPINKIWSGPKIPSLYNTDQNLGYLILQVLQQTPNEITQISADTNVSVTCRRMRDRTLKFAKYLQKLSMKEGDMIGFVTVNSENLAPTVFACFALGLPVNPLSPIMNVSDIVQMYSVTKPKMIFCDAENLKVVQSAVNEMKSDAKILTVMKRIDGYECVSDILNAMKDENVDNFDFPDIDPNSTAVILCSSGSTGFPKGICKSHKQIISHFHQNWPRSKISKTIYFQGSPIFWWSGFSALIVGSIYKFTRIITTEAYDAQLLLDIIINFKVSVLIVPVYMLVSLLKLEIMKPMKSVECLLVGGAVVSDHACEKLKPFIPNGKIVPGYGCTEQDFLSVNLTNKNYGSSGIVFYNMEMKIVDDDNNSLGPNEKGEIWVKSPVKFSNYFNEPAKTAETFVGDWFKTGDIGYFDDDGYLYVVDRKKELLKYKSFQITPSEIEAIINEIKGIASSCVVGVPEPHTGNDIIHAFVILEGLGGLTEDFILNYVNDKVIDPKRIRGGVHIVESFPSGITGKVDRKKVREMALKY